MWNVCTGDGRLLLNWCSRKTAEHYLNYYQTRYGKGRPYPNGKGFYDFEFFLIWEGKI